MPQAKIDPHLATQLQANTEGEIQAVVTLNPDDPSQLTPSPERTEELTRTLVERVSSRSGTQPRAVNVFRFLGSFSIAADPKFLSDLLNEPEVKAAVSNRRSGATTAVA